MVKLSNKLIHKTERVIDFLLSKSKLQKPMYNLIMTDGSKGGYYSPDTKELAIPKWIFETDCHNNPDTTYCFYYVAHELAHACVGFKEAVEHGELFYNYFKKLCPVQLQYWELHYLPDNRRFLDVPTRGLSPSFC